MRRNLLLVLAIVLILVGLFLLVKVIQTISPKGQGALQVAANIKSKVYLDDKLLGEAPVCKCEQNNTILQGEYTVKIVPDDTQFTPFVVRIKIEPGLLTHVERTFLPGSLASAYVLTLEKTGTKEPQLFVGTIPDSAMVTIDNNPGGTTPLTLDSISESEHEIEIQKEGFAKKTIRVRTIPEHKLLISAYLGTESAENMEINESTSPTPTTEPDQEDEEEKLTAENQIEINETQVGFLRVRSTPSTAGRELTRVEPGEIFTYTETQNGWYKINLPDGTSGWVSGSYVTEVNQ